MTQQALASSKKEQLIEQARLAASGDMSAFARLVEEYKHLVCAVAYATLADHGHSEDVAQQVFVKLWQHLPRLENLATLPAWLRTTSQRMSLNVRRERKNVPLVFVEESAAMRLDIEQTSDSPFETLSEKQRAQVVSEMLRTLPYEYRETLVLFYREGQSLSHVAEWLQISVDNVRQRLVRGRKLLRAKVEPVLACELEATRPSKAFTAGVLALVGTMSLGSSEAMSRVMRGKRCLSLPTLAVIFVLLGGVVGLVASGVVQRKGSSANAALLSGNYSGAALRKNQKRHRMAAVFSNPQNGELAVDGFAVDEAGDPVSAATVTLGSDGARKVITDSDGYFLFERVSPGQISITVNSSDGIGTSSFSLSKLREPVMIELQEISRLKLQIVDGLTARPIAGAVVATNRGSEVSDHDGWVLLVGPNVLYLSVKAQGYGTVSQFLHIPRGGITTRKIAMSLGAHVAGSVVDEIGHPISDVAVAIDSIDNKYALTDEQGHFDLGWQSPNESTLVAVHKAWVQKGAVPLFLVAGRDSVQNVITMRVGKSVRGSVQDGTGKPIAGAQIFYSGHLSEDIFSMTMPNLHHEHVQSDASGRFFISGVATAEITILAKKNLMTAGPVKVKVGELPTLVMHELSIVGKVLDDRGLPREGASVVARSANGSVEDVSDSHGEFRLTGLFPNEYEISLDRDPFAVPVVAKPGIAGLVLQSSAFVTVTGRLRGSAGEAIENCEVKSASSEQLLLASAEVRRVGAEFSATHVPSGARFFEVACEDYIATRFSKTLPAEDSVDIGTITLAKGIEIRGRVQTADGQPVPFAEVRVGQGLTQLTQAMDVFKLQAQAATSATYTAADGRFLLTGVSPEADQIAATHGTLGNSAIVPFSPSSHDVVLSLQPRVRLFGRLTSHRKPLPQAVITLDAEKSFSTVTDENGNYELVLPPDVYQFRVRTTATSRYVMTLNAAHDVEFNHEFDATGQVKVGANRVGAWASLMLADGHQGQETGRKKREKFYLATRFEPDWTLPPMFGYARWTLFNDVPPGPYTVCFFAAQHSASCKNIEVDLRWPTVVTFDEK